MARCSISLNVFTNCNSTFCGLYFCNRGMSVLLNPRGIISQPRFINNIAARREDWFSIKVTTLPSTPTGKPPTQDIVSVKM